MLRVIWRQLRFAFLLFWLTVKVTVRRLVAGRRHPEWGWRLELSAEILRHSITDSIGSPVRELRSAIPSAVVPPPVSRRLSRESAEVGGRPVEITTPKGWKPGDRTVLYLHGGGYVVCGPRTHREIIGRFADATKARCVAPVYRMAPEAPYPAAVDDAISVYRALLEHDVDPARLLLAGDSAGGGLCVATMLRLKAEDRPLPSGAVLLSPWLDLTMTGESVDKNEHLDYLQRAPVEHYRDLYLAGADRTDPFASPLHGDPTGLPPIRLLIGTVEIFHSEALAFVDKAKAAGVDITLHEGEGMIHVWPAFATVFPQGKAAYSAIGEWVANLP